MRYLLQGDLKIIARQKPQVFDFLKWFLQLFDIFRQFQEFRKIPLRAQLPT